MVNVYLINKNCLKIRDVSFGTGIFKYVSNAHIDGSSMNKENAQKYHQIAKISIYLDNVQVATKDMI